MEQKNDPSGKPPDRRKYSRGGTPAAPRSCALRGPSGLANEQERQASDLLKRMSDALFGKAGPANDGDRTKLYRKVAAVLRREPGCKATSAQVRAVAQRIRTRNDERMNYPVNLSPQYYAYVAMLREKLDCSLKEAMDGIVEAYIETHGSGA